MPQAKGQNKKPSFYSLQRPELHKGINSVSENYTAFWCLFLSTSGNLYHVVPPHKVSQCARATWQDQFKQMSGLWHFLFLVFLPCHQIPGKEIQISDTLIIHFTFYFALSSTWVKITILKITMLMKNRGQPQLSQLLPTSCPLLDSPLPKCSTSLVLVNLMRCLVFPAPGEIPGWH